MSKRAKIETLGKFIGLRMAHVILIKLTNKQESIKGLQLEVDHYDELSTELAKGNWNFFDIERIKELAEKRCRKKLDEYHDIGNEKYKLVDDVIDEVMKDLGLK